MSCSLDFEEATKLWTDFEKYLDYCNCPASGDFIAWKGAIALLDDHPYDGRGVHAEYCLVKLRIPEKSPRLRAKNSKKCRCMYAEVVDIQRRDGSSYPDSVVAYSIREVNDHYFYDPAYYKTQYMKGQNVYGDGFDDDRERECSHGIHFFMCREDAMAYIGL